MTPDTGPERRALRDKAALTAAIRDRSRAALVVNSRSRKTPAVAARLEASIAKHGIRLLSAEHVTEPHQLTQALQRALSLGPDLLIVGGGDGTLATAVNLLAYQDVALGVLPLGTTNNFARSLALPLNLDRAIATIATGKVVDVDLGQVRTSRGERLFANLASLGLSVEVAQRTPPLLKRRIGRAAYALTALRMLPEHRPIQATVTTPDATETFWTHQLNIANGRFHAGSVIARDASIDDHQLVAYRLGDARRARLSLATAAQILRGTRRRLTAVPFIATRWVAIVTDPPALIDVDGEVHGTTPATFRTASEALRVVVEGTFPDT